jgi:hypothetical protein
MVKNSIFVGSKGKWQGYENIKNKDSVKGYNDYLEGLWLKYQPYADKHFRQELKENEQKFNQRIWEMKIACDLLDAKHSLMYVQFGKGPDICIDHYNTKIWVECVCPDVGDLYPNAVPGLAYEPLTDEDTGKPIGNIAGWSSVEVGRQIKLRYLSAIRDKKTMIQQYINSGIVAPNEPVILAINSANITHEPVGGEFPLVMGLCYGLGDQQITFQLNPETNISEYKGSSYTSELTISKYKNGDFVQQIDSAVFLIDNYAILSAIMFSYFKLSRTTPYSENQNSVYLGYNPFANNPLPDNSINLYTHKFWCEDMLYDDNKQSILKCNLRQKLSDMY